MSGKIYRNSAVAIAAAAMVAVLAAGCGSSGTTSAGASSPSGGKTPSSKTSSPSSASVVSSASVPFPIAVGNTWVYRTTTLAGTTGTATNKILAVSPASGGQQVTMSNAIDTLGTTTSTKSVYVFYNNGSISYPFSQFSTADSGTTVKLISGGLFWPPAAELASGKASHSTLKISFTEDGQTQDVTAHVTVQGAGSGSVTVPAGTYSATIVDMTMAETFDGVGFSIEVKSWLAAGVGPVQSEAITNEDGHSEVVSKQELTSFSKS